MLSTWACAVLPRYWRAGFASPESPGCLWGVGAHLQLGPLDPAHAARRVPPGMLGPVDQLRVPQLVRVSGLNLLGHLLQPLHVGLGTGSGKVGSRGGGGSGRGQGMLQLSTWNTLFLHTHTGIVWMVIPGVGSQVSKDQGERAVTCKETQQTPGMKLLLKKQLLMEHRSLPVL